MFKIGDLVRHKTADITGTVIGYGIRLDEARTITIKVKIKAEDSFDLIAEDVCNKWKIRHQRILACTLPHFPQRQLSKSKRDRQTVLAT